MNDDGQQSAKSSPPPLGEQLNAPRIGVFDTRLPDVEAAKAVTIRPAHDDFASFEQGYISHYISLADTKAAWAFAIASGSLAYMISREGLGVHLLSPTPEIILLVAPISLLFASAVCSFLTIIPRLATSGEGLVFYGSVAQHPDAATYVNKVVQTSPSNLTERRLAHCFDIARVCTRKYRFLRRAMWLGAIGLIAAVPSLIVFG